MEYKENWKLKGDPVPLNGGFMHKMYRIDTERGIYALKLLNRFVMQRETAMDNFAEAERLERLLEERGVPILPALTIDGRKMQEIDGEYFYLFDYYDGKPLCADEITEYHCAQMGSVLAAIHDADRKNVNEKYKEMSVDWDFYLSAMERADTRLYEMLRSCYTLLVESQENGNRARKKLPNILAVCHNDMDCKNVLWKGNDYRIIDLECLSYSNPMMELFELALCWSGYEKCQINFRLFQAFLQGYASTGEELPADWETLYDCNNGRLEWLEYNLKRVLGIDCGDDEKQMGIGQVEETLRHIVYYAKMREQILEHCI